MPRATLVVPFIVIVFLSLSLFKFAPFPTSAVALNGIWTIADDLNFGRFLHTATLLPNGKVLVAGGFSNGTTVSNAELYNPASGSWSNTGDFNFARQNHTATLLPNGKVLVAGGYDNALFFPFNKAELYDPATGSWSNTGDLNFARYSHTATLLANGKVLVSGGIGTDGITTNLLSKAELYDPATGNWSNTGDLNFARERHTATLLVNGNVLVVGGAANFALNKAELYVPATGSWSVTGDLNFARLIHTATLLQNGKVLVAGGNGNSLTVNQGELYNPATGGWTITGDLNFGRFLHTATLLPNGKVLVAGGSLDASGAPIAKAELYDPATGSWSNTGDLNFARVFHTATLLANGQVLVAGGTGNSYNKAELSELDASGSSWTKLSPTGEPPAPRSGAIVPVYDPSSNRLIIFGGNTIIPCCTAYNDVWVLTNANGLGGTPQWIKLNPIGLSGFPAPRGHHTAVYDSANNRMTIFAGGQWNQTSPGFFIFVPRFNDVWVLTNANGLGGASEWIPLSPSGSAPAPRELARAVYDPGSNRMTIFGGGNNGINDVPNDVWVLTNANGLGGAPAWIQLNPTGQIPPAVQSHTATYDPITNRMTIFAGSTPSFINDTHVLTNANGLGGTPQWINLGPTGPLPSVRGTHIYGYDSVQNRLVISGQGNSSGLFNDVWVLTHANGLGGAPAWVNTIPNGVSCSPPADVIIHGGTLDPARNRLIEVRGGSDVPAAIGLEVWVLANASALAAAPCVTPTPTPTPTPAPLSDLSIEMTASPDPVLAGSNITYNITITNNGPDAATSLTMTDDLMTGNPPNSLTLQLITTPLGWSLPCAINGGIVRCTTASLAAGATAEFTVTAAVNCSIDVGTQLSNTAAVVSSVSDPNPTNNSATAKSSSTRDISPADGFTRIIEEDQNDPIGNRTPLILIHGIHGNEQPDDTDDIARPNSKYFEQLLCYFNSINFKAKYKIYRFHYVSDQFSVWQIARALRNDIDDLVCSDRNLDRDFVIIAHSMGGLVARSYMNEHSHYVGRYAGKRGGERINKLITLGTPHHGAPGAGSQSRDELAANDSWRTVMELLSVYYWQKDQISGMPSADITFDLPNRRDLLWDNFDNRVNSNNADLNTWLRQLNSNESYGSKTIAYYSYINIFDTRRVTFIIQNNISLRSPGGLLLGALSIPVNDLHRRLLVANIALDYGMNHAYLLNDGLVPRESAAFNGFALNKRVECRGLDHLDIFNKGAKTCANNKLLFDSLSNDLNLVGFDGWIRDDRNGDVLLFNSSTGDYQFTKCGVNGFTLIGKGKTKNAACRLTLNDVRADRKVKARLNKCATEGDASIEVLPARTQIDIRDTNTDNNNCSCP